MGKTLPLLIMLLFVQQVHANIIQGNYRWRNDDGNETTATWKAAENTSIANVGTSEVLRLRFELNNGWDIDGSNSTIQLWYNDGSTEQQVTTSATGAFMLAQSSTTLTDGQATTAQLSGSLPFVPGVVVTSSNDVNIAIPGSSRTEYEWAIKAGAGFLTSRTYTFSIRGANVAEPTGPASTLVTTGTLPLKLLSFTAQLADKRVALQWNTAEEKSVSHFEIEKSTDGSRYTLIGKQPAAAGAGNKTYSHTDNGMLAASNYYRLKIVDKDGSFRYSNISRVSTAGSKNSLSVYPNPARDRLNISLKADAGMVKVALQDASGRVLKTFTVISDGSEINQVADISTLQRGIYFISFNKQTIRFVKE